MHLHITKDQAERIAESMRDPWQMVAILTEIAPPEWLAWYLAQPIPRPAIQLVLPADCSEISFSVSFLPMQPAPMIDAKIDFGLTSTATHQIPGRGTVKTCAPREWPQLGHLGQRYQDGCSRSRCRGPEVKLIYIAAPYTENPPVCTEIAAAAAERIKQDGRAFPICPHLLGAGNGDPEYMYAGTLETMRRCDAVLTLPRWEQSRGAMAEVRTADRMPLPVFHREDELMHWLSGGQVGTRHGQRGNLAELCAGLPQTLVMLEVNTGEEHEIRTLGKQPGDGLIYTCRTAHGISFHSTTGAEFIQVAHV